MKYTKILTFLFICSIFFMIEAREILLPQTPVSTYEDTESSVSVQLPFLKENDREFSLSLSLMATASNHLEVAFGLDKNRDGELSLDNEQRMFFFKNSFQLNNSHTAVTFTVLTDAVGFNS